MTSNTSNENDFKDTRKCPNCGHRFVLGPEGDLNCPLCGIESRPTDANSENLVDNQ